LPLIPIKNKDLICGVVGYGAIGKAIVAKLLSMGHKVIVYDSNMQQLTNIKSSREITITNELSALVAFADYIFGCTGRDITTSTDLFRLSPKNKTLISCSSEDKEFLSLLHTIQRTKSGKSATQPLQDIEYINEAGGIIRILRGGFPINFDNSGESVPSQDIQLTRALVLGSILQAIQFFKNPEILNTHFIYSLDSTIQKFIVSEWLKHQSSNRFSGSVIESFQNTKWIAENSGGLCVDSFPNNQLKSNLTNPSSLFRLKNKVLITRHVILQPNLSYSK
jgi:S-adenosylhomocysteine hydrolase